MVRDGLVALQQFSSNNIPKTVEVNGVQYTASLRNNVLIVWMPETQAEQLLNSPANLTDGCNCGNGAKKPLFFHASDINVNIHETGHP